MKRWILFLAAAAVVLFLPDGQGIDVAKLQPVELLYINMEQGRIAVYTDTGEYGIGNALEDALRDVRATAKGEIFLDTVDYVLVTEETKSEISELRHVLRPSANLILATGPVQPKDITAYLAVHKPDVTLKNWMMGQRELPKLMTAGERYYLV